MNEGFFKEHQSDVENCSIQKEEWDKCCKDIEDWLETTPDHIVNTFFTTPRRSPHTPTPRRVLSQGVGSVKRKVLADIPEEVYY